MLSYELPVLKIKLKINKSRKIKKTYYIHPLIWTFKKKIHYYFRLYKIAVMPDFIQKWGKNRRRNYFKKITRYTHVIITMKRKEKKQICCNLHEAGRTLRKNQKYSSGLGSYNVRWDFLFFLKPQEKRKISEQIIKSSVIYEEGRTWVKVHLSVVLTYYICVWTLM